VYAESLAGAKPDFEIAALCNVIITDDIEGALLPSKASLGFYIGGMGAEGANFHKNLMARMGYEEQANEIQRLFLEGKRDEAIATVPSSFADEISLVGPPERIKERLQAWDDSAVTTLNVAVGDVDTMRRIAELVLG
jgi:alkanesulfonate monooxygenase SsuD/methylene tetrahydromethanopterin reductase-like flavin-dependent oxidoreductase (luciferase family)